VTHTKGFCIRKTELSGLFNRVEGDWKIIGPNLEKLSVNWRFLRLQKERVIGLGFLTMLLFLEGSRREPSIGGR